MLQNYTINALYHQYEREKAQLEMYGHVSSLTYEEWLEIKKEREVMNDILEKLHKESFDEDLQTYKAFVSYLSDKAIGDIKVILEAFEDNFYNKFLGYKEVTKEIINGELYLHFEHNDNKLKAKWQPSDNYAVWQTCGVCGDDYSGYLLFPTYKDNEYFCLYYNC